MQNTAQSFQTPLHELLDEASRALAALDADRLEELTSSCLALNRELPQLCTSIRSMPANKVRRTLNKLVGLGSMLEVTRGNLEVMRQITALETGMLEYAKPAHVWMEEAKSDGDN